MSSSSDFELIHGQLHVTKDPAKPEILGRGPLSIHGATYQQGPNLQGDDQAFPNIWGATMIGPLQNSDSPPPVIPGSLCTGVNNPYSLAVIGDAAIFDNLDVAQDIAAGNNIIAQGEVMSRCGGHILSAKKNFDISHPTKEGWRLRHTCPEGPSNDVYFRGRVKNKTEIHLPEYWKGLVDINTIIVNITPIGAHQDVIIKRWDDSKVYLQAKGGMPIDCFYYIMAERKDGEKLIPEYPGESPTDYPGNNDEYSISGYHYDVKEK
jgi:hypothetical protein